MKILIGYDGSEPAREAIRDLHRAGLPPDAKALVIYAANVWPHFSKSCLEAAAGAQSSQASPMQRKAHALVVESIAEAEALAAEGEALVRADFPTWKVSHEGYAGSPYVALSRQSVEADLVVVGSQGKSKLARMVMGSVSHHVLMHAPGSVRISRSSSAAAPTAQKPVRIVLGVDGSRHSAVAVSAVAGRVWPAGSEVKIIAVLDRTFWTAMANPQSSAWAWIAEPDQNGEAWALRAVQRVGQNFARRV